MTGSRRRIALVLFFLAFPGFALSQWSFRLSGGGGWTDGGDLNRHLKSWRAYFDDHDLSPASYDFRLKELHFLWEGEVEVDYRLSSKFSVALGLEFWSGESRGEMSSAFQQKKDYFHSPADFGTVSTEELSLQHPQFRLQTLPLYVTLYYHFPSRSRWDLFLGAGAGYYPGRLKYHEEYQYDFDHTDDKNLSGSLLRFMDQYSSSGVYTEESRCAVLGLHLRGGLEFKLRSHLSLVLEATGRWVEWRNWEGTKSDEFSWKHIWGLWGSLTESGSGEESGSGLLWLERFKDDFSRKIYERLVLSQGKPLSVEGAEPARISGSGFSLRLGVRIYF